MQSTTIITAAVAAGFAVAAPFSSKNLEPLHKRADTSSFYIVDNDSGSLANAITSSGVFFGSSWNSPTLFTIDSSTSILMTANPGQTTYDSYINAGSYNPVRIGTSASSGFLKCSISDNELSCTASGSYTEFLLDSSSSTANSTDYQLYLVQPGTTSTEARTATLNVQYGTTTPSTTAPTEFYLSTSMGYAVDFGSGSGIYAGTDYAKEAAGSVYTLDSGTGYLTTASSSSDSNYVAYIDTTTDGYGAVGLSTMPMSSSTMTPLTCQIATDGSNNITCAADDYVDMWLDLGKSSSGDYTLYMSATGYASNGTQRLAADIVVANCTACS